MTENRERKTKGMSIGNGQSYVEKVACGTGEMDLVFWFRWMPTIISPPLLVLRKRKLNLVIQFCGKEPGQGVEDKLKDKGQL